MSDIDKTNEKLREQWGPSPLAGVYDAWRAGKLSPLKEIQREMDERLKRKLSRREYLTEQILAEQVASQTKLSYHEAVALMMEFFDVGGSAGTFEKLKHKYPGQPLDELITLAIIIARAGATPSGSENNSHDVQPSESATLG